MKIRFRRLHLGIASLQKYTRKGLFVAVVLSLVGFGYVEFKTQATHAAFGGNFAFTVTPDPATIPSGDIARYRVNYSCSVSDCTDVVLTMSKPLNADKYIVGIGTISNDTSTADNKFDANMNGIWTMKPVIPAGTSGTLYVSWQTKNYTTPNGTQLKTSTVASSGSETLPAVESAPVTVTSSPDWDIVKTATGAPDFYASDTYEYTYSISMPYNSSASQLGRENLGVTTVVDQLPAGAVYKSSTLGGTYDAVAHTVTWTFDHSNWYPASETSGPFNYHYGNGTPKVVVTFPKSKNPDGSTVTNTATFTGTPIDGSAPITKSSSVSKTISYTPTTAGGVGKRFAVPIEVMLGPDNSIPATAPHSFRSGINNTGTSDLTGTITDKLPCADVVSSAYVSDITTPFASYTCNNPTEVVESFRIDLGPGTIQKLTALRWKTNKGTVGSYSGASSLVGANQTVSVVDAGIPAGEKLIAYQADFSLPATSGSSAWVWTVGKPTSTVKIGDRITNTSSFTYTDGIQNFTAEASSYYTIRGKLPIYRTSITDAAGQGVSYMPSEKISWNADYTVYAGPSGDNADVTPDWFIYIPKGLKYVSGSIKYTDLANIGGVKPNLVEVKNGTGNLAGGTLLHLRWPTTASIKGYSATDKTYRSIAVNFQTIVDPQVAANIYNALPPDAGQPASTTPTSIVSAAYAVGYSERGTVSDAIYQANQFFASTDTADYNMNGNATETNALYDQSWSVSPGAVAYVNLGVIGDANVYGSMGHTSVMGAATYQFQILNASNDNTVLTDMVMYQTLPRINDAYVSENASLAPRGSEYNVYLTGPVTAPAGVEVKYSTAANPCRPEVHATNVGCDNNWVTTVTDWSTVTAIRFFLPGNYSPGAGAIVTEPITTDGTAQPGLIAWTSIAYRATNAATGANLVPAETPRVGLMVDPFGLEAHKTVDKPFETALVAGDTLNYTVTVKNTSTFSLPVTTLNIVDNTSAVAPYATYKAGSLVAKSSSGGAVAQPTIAGTAIQWTGALGAGETLTITYTFVVKDGVKASTVLTNRLTAMGTYDDGRTVASNCMLGTEDGCTVSNKIAESLATTGSSVLVVALAGVASMSVGAMLLIRRSVLTK